MTRRRLRRLHAEAQRWYREGVYWESGYQVEAPTGPMRIAFEAGRQAHRDKKPGRGMGLDVWAQVLADWMRS